MNQRGTLPSMTGSHPLGNINNNGIDYASACQPDENSIACQKLASSVTVAFLFY